MSRYILGFILFLTFTLNCSDGVSSPKYVFFIHNRFIEELGINGVHPEYDRVEYHAMLDAFRKEGFTVYSEIRPSGTDAKAYASKIAKQVDSLIKTGVHPSDITIVGTSKGGFIAQHVSSQLKNPELNFVFIGICMDDEEELSAGINFCGNILSIYETTDDYGQSCDKIKNSSKLTVTRYKEIRLNAGVRHGFLYKALPLWLKPCIQWANKNYELKDPAKKDLTARIDSLLQVSSSNPFNGIVLISQNGVTKYMKIQGYSDLDKKTSLRMNDQFGIGSISKQLTAAMAMQEYEKGRLKLEIPIHFYLPELKQKWADSVSMHHLLSHTHGIMNLDSPLTFRPGSQFSYSQIGYDLASKILEKTSGKSFPTLSEEFFRNCSLSHTTHPALKNYPLLVNSYLYNASGNYTKDSTPFEIYAAAGGLISSAYDLITWNNFLHGGKVLSDSVYQLMITPKKNAMRIHPLFGPMNYCYGIMTSNNDDLLLIGHTGIRGGFVSMNFYFPHTKTSIVILSNTFTDPEDMKKSFFYHLAILDLLREDLLNNK